MGWLAGWQGGHSSELQSTKGRALCSQGLRTSPSWELGASGQPEHRQKSVLEVGAAAGRWVGESPGMGQEGELLRGAGISVSS